MGARHPDGGLFWAKFICMYHLPHKIYIQATIINVKNRYNTIL